MTYCVGFRTEQGVFISADSSFSSMAAPSFNAINSDARTVFGELQGEVGKKPWRSVFESGLKLAVRDDTVVGFAGDVSTACSLVEAYWETRAKTSDLRKALRDALLSVTPTENDADGECLNFCV